MSTRVEIRVPEIGESITEVEIGSWLKAAGDAVRKDEPVVTLESEKATLDLPSPEAGVLGQILKPQGETAKVGEVIGYLDGAGQAASAGAKSEPKPAPVKVPEESKAATVAQPPAPAPAPPTRPAAQPVAAEPGVAAAGVDAAAPAGRALREDVPGRQRETEAQASARVEDPEAALPLAAPGEVAGREEEVVPMSRLRRTAAERLVAAQHAAALLTTFNEIDMFAVVALRKEFGPAFQEKHGVKLGFMSFFVKAAIDALKQYPALNAEVRGTNIVYHNYYDIGIAVGGGKGLVVPVLRNAERLSFAEVEIAIGDFGRRAKENKLKLEELQGGTFTISNGGVYGSLLSTPIVSPPQSGVLGLHAIQDRPVAREGLVVVRPMMYVALTYDHRVVDGREAVLFLRRIKELIEDPARMLIEA